MENQVRLTADEIENLMSKNPDVEWELEVFDSPPAASLALTLGGSDADIKAKILRKRIRPFSVVLVLFSVVGLLSIPDGWNTQDAITGAVVFSATLACITFDVRTTKVARSRGALRDLLAKRAPAETVTIYRFWVEPAKFDDFARAHLVEWIRAKWELADLGLWIDEGVKMRNKLSPTDPMRGTMQMEIETLSSKHAALRVGQQEHTDRLNAAAQQHLAKRKREVAEEKERLAERKRHRKHQEELRAVAHEEQARLEAQERAQKWMEGEN